MPPTGLHPPDQSRPNQTVIAISDSYQSNQPWLILLISIISGILFFLGSIIGFIYLGFATNGVLVFIGSLVVLFFGPVWNNIYGGITFIYLQHPIKIGDRCVVDNERLTVEKMGIWQTVFLKENNEKLYWTTTNLLNKSITISNQGSEMRDTLEIIVGGSTSNENIKALVLKINEYVERNPEIWCPAGHSFQIQEIEDMKDKYSLGITHAKNFQNYEEKKNRRSELILELKKSFEQLDIKCLSVRVLTK